MGIVRKQGGDGREVTSRGNSHELRMPPHEMRQRLRPNRLPVVRLCGRTGPGALARERLAASRAPIGSESGSDAMEWMAFGGPASGSRGGLTMPSPGRDGDGDLTAAGRPSRGAPRF